MWPFTKKEVPVQVEPPKEVKVITGTMPTNRVLRQFKATNNFYSDELQTEYVKGQIYNLREGNEKLSVLLKRWESEGKVQLL